MFGCYFGNKMLVLRAGGHDGENSRTQSSNGGERGHGIGGMAVSVKGAEMPGERIIVNRTRL
jgi:hypothetical protein